MRSTALMLAASLVVFVSVIKSILTLIILKKTQSHDHGEIKTTGVAYSAVSSATTILWLMMLFTAKPDCFQPIDARIWVIFVAICVLSVVDLALSNVAISILDPTLQQCLAALAPVFTFLAESLLALELKQPLIVFFVVVVAAGACATTFAKLSGTAYDESSRDLEDNELLLMGILAMVGAAAVSACKLVLLRASALRSRISPIAMLFWVDTMVFLLLTPLSIGLGEMYTLVQQLTSGPPVLSIGVAFTGALGGVRFLSELYALQYMSAVDLSVVNTFAAIAYVLICFLLFPSSVHHSGVIRWTALYVCSVAVTFTGLVGYVLAVRHFSPDHLVAVKCGTSCLVLDVPLGADDGACDEVCDTCGSTRSPRADESASQKAEARICACGGLLKSQS